VSEAIESIPVVIPTPYTARSMLAHVNATIVTIKRMLHHRHDDAAWWRETPWRSVPDAQRARRYGRIVANLLHVERATQRGRIHGRRFATLEEQRAWLAKWETRSCWTVQKWFALPHGSNLVRLRAGELER
jgi:hypothetical protein